MAMRQKEKLLQTAYSHFKEFELPLDIDYKSYLNIVGSQTAIHAVAVKRGFKAWKYLVRGLVLKYPELSKPKAPPPPPVSKPSPLEALNKAAENADEIENNE